VTRLRILVGGMLAGNPNQGGASWAVLQYVLGLERLGHQVELLDPVVDPSPVVKAYFRKLVEEFGISAHLTRYEGQPPDVLLNISGMVHDEVILERTPIRVYLDLDPVFNQLWHTQGVDVGLDGHTHYVSVGTRLPETAFAWTSTLPPVVLERWPAGAGWRIDALTTVANWRAYGSIEHDGVHYGQKAHSLRPMVDLPRRTGERFALALGIHADETRDLETLAANRWQILDPRKFAGTPGAYRRFVSGSWAEFGLAKSGYVVGRSGWFSDRSACYLASGRPVVAQDTGFGDRLPTGAGLFAFASVEDVVDAAKTIRRDYGRHSRAARAIAEEFLDSDLVLKRLLREVGAVAHVRTRPVHEAGDDELAEASGAREIVRRRPSAFRSSAPIVEVEARFGDGRLLTLVIKDLARGSQTPRLRRAKPGFLYDPLREIEVYRDVLAAAGLGTPELHGALIDPKRDRYLLALEKVDGIELYQVGEVEVWQDAMRWLARMHDRFRGCVLPSSLIRYDGAYFERWRKRAGRFGDFDATGYETLIERLASLTPTLLHGDLYPSNVVVAGARICAVDWELAAVGPAVVDVAALTTGWPRAEQNLLVAAYREELSTRPPEPELENDVELARLHLAVQWLGWSRHWSPPPEHAQDFSAQAQRLSHRLGLQTDRSLKVVSR
jgi:phosphotransferase family enzyme